MSLTDATTENSKYDDECLHRFDADARGHHAGGSDADSRQGCARPDHQHTGRWIQRDQLNYAYDTRGRVGSISPGTGSTSRTITFGYDAQGNLQSATDPLGRRRPIRARHGGSRHHQDAACGRGHHVQPQCGGAMSSALRRPDVPRMHLRTTGAAISRRSRHPWPPEAARLRSAMTRTAIITYKIVRPGGRAADDGL